MSSDRKSRFLLGTAVCGGLLIVCYVVFVGTAWGHRIDDAAYLGRGALSGRIITFDAVLLRKVTGATVLSAASFLVLIGIFRRSSLVGVLAAVGFGTAVVGAEFLKHVLPWQALAPDDARLGKDLQSGSFPSGHATIGTALALGLLLVSPSRWRPQVASAAGILTSLFAGGVLFAGWHRGSDALGALAWSGICMNVAAAVAVRLRGRRTMVRSNHVLTRSVVLGFLMVGALGLVSEMTAPNYPYGDMPFFVLTGLIVAGSFWLTAWYAWQLRAVDWGPNGTV